MHNENYLLKKIGLQLAYCQLNPSIVKMEIDLDYVAKFLDRLAK